MADTIQLRVTQVSTNQTALDFPRNLTNIFNAIRHAVEQQSDLVVFDELTVTGYECNDEFARVNNDVMRDFYQQIADYSYALDPNLVVSVGGTWRYADRSEATRVRTTRMGDETERMKNPLYNRAGRPFNVQTVIAGGQVHGMTAKMNLFDYERGYEGRYFQEWSMASANDVRGVFGTIKVPFDETHDVHLGRPVFFVTDGRVRGYNLAQAICEEKWVATQYDGQPHDDSRYEDVNIIPATMRYVGKKDGLVMAIANASPPARDKIDKHYHLDTLASRYADVVLDTDGLGSSGSTFTQFGHRVIAQDGKILSSGKRLSFDGFAADTHTISVQNVDPKKRGSKAHKTIKRDFQIHNPIHTLSSDNDTLYAYDADWDRPDNPHRHAEETLRMTAHWLFDYMCKTGSQGIAEALSGGADSCFNAVIVAAMVRLAVHDLGVDGFLDRMSHLKYKTAIEAAYTQDGEEAAIQTCLQNMLTTDYMPTNNSDLSKTEYASEILIEGGVDTHTGETVDGIGGKFMTHNVQDLLDFYAVIYALEDSSAIPQDKMEHIRRDIAAFLNTRPGQYTDKELADQAADLKAKYPEIRDLVSTAYASDGVAYENIQARGRQVLIMLIANKEGKMAIANPNLDEARNAYATYGGDLHSGTINLNAHLNKDYQLELMRYLYEHGLKGVMKPVRALGPVLRNKPSAELQPKNEDGEVTQSDEEALKGSFKQLDTAADYMLYAKIDTHDGPRRLNASEVFEKCKADRYFAGVSDEQLFDMLVYRYERWMISQHKIHASPVAPTYGRNVDHQTSMRTPNFGNSSHDELAELAVNLLFDRAECEGRGWDEQKRSVLCLRARSDEGFVKDVIGAMRQNDDDITYSLQKLYDRVCQDGWQKVFGALDVDSPQYLIDKVRRERAAAGSPKPS